MDKKITDNKLTTSNRKIGLFILVPVLAITLVIAAIALKGHRETVSPESTAKPGAAIQALNQAATDQAKIAADDEKAQGSATTATSAPSSLPQPQTLLDLKGSGSKTTEFFTTAASDWDLNWTYDCSSNGDRGVFQVYINNSDGSSSRNSSVNQLGKSGSDVEHFHTGGKFYLEVNSTCSWTINAKG